MTILITGATGLVGSRLLTRFVENGVECRALVRPGRELSTRAEVVEGDLLDATTLKQAVVGVDAIVHLAAVFRTQNEADIWRANLDGTKNLVAAAKAHVPDARFIMASTGLVYDANAPRPGVEDDATHPTLAYPASKLAAENELRSSGLNWTILRLPFCLRRRGWASGVHPTFRQESRVASCKKLQPCSPYRRGTGGRTCFDRRNGRTHHQRR